MIVFQFISYQILDFSLLGFGPSQFLFQFFVGSICHKVTSQFYSSPKFIRLEFTLLFTYLESSTHCKLSLTFLLLILFCWQSSSLPQLKIKIGGWTVYASKKLPGNVGYNLNFRTLFAQLDYNHYRCFKKSNYMVGSKWGTVLIWVF